MIIINNKTSYLYRAFILKYIISGRPSCCFLPQLKIQCCCHGFTDIRGLWNYHFL